MGALPFFNDFFFKVHFRPSDLRLTIRINTPRKQARLARGRLVLAEGRRFVSERRRQNGHMAELGRAYVADSNLFPPM